jgi:hypothetical protein
MIGWGIVSRQFKERSAFIFRGQAVLMCLTFEALHPETLNPQILHGLCLWDTTSTLPIVVIFV